MGWLERVLRGRKPEVEAAFVEERRLLFMIAALSGTRQRAPVLLRRQWPFM